ncbi:hypothetical protein CH330_03725 [candidate division WOR-3 bacterium JGI_Cruoil_03_51_56]|mgnify:CR=1 FL=1|uniref:Hydrogenase 3 maturation endopeptidase HyCI n=1 Tax=candidate division WOR-3 bacterium JGI_Cruoil_03_51_56 TaxID=1973747 RepID=A0A235BUS9_UNCW3|nr:MAG: hypothetical protein CH330_03725 [candidate division WOR-3 bacterium JGI_Cruoil_03_51_56]
MKAVILGIGNRMRGDDAVGSLVVDELAGIRGLEVIDVRTAPENYIEPVSRLEPKKVLIVDACNFGGRPGEFRLFNPEEIDRLAGGIVSTHTLPLSMTIALLEKNLKAEIRVLGVQPASIEFDAGLSEPVAKVVPGLVSFIRQWAGV